MTDPHLKLLKSLNDQGVEYLLVGGMLAIAYGVPRVTKDIDLFIRKTRENAEKILKVLSDLGFGTTALTSVEELINTEVTIFKDYLRLDVLTKIKGLEFEEAYQRKKVIQLGSIPVYVLSLEDLITSKKAAGRAGDLEDVTHLEKIKKMLK